MHLESESGLSLSMSIHQDFGIIFLYQVCNLPLFIVSKGYIPSKPIIFLDPCISFSPFPSLSNVLVSLSIHVLSNGGWVVSLLFFVFNLLLYMPGLGYTVHLLKWVSFNLTYLCFFPGGLMPEIVVYISI